SRRALRQISTRARKARSHIEDAEVEGNYRFTSRVAHCELHDFEQRHDWIDRSRGYPGALDRFRSRLDDAARESSADRLAKRVRRLRLRRLATMATTDAVHPAGKGGWLHDLSGLADRSSGKAQRAAGHEQNSAAVRGRSRGWRWVSRARRILRSQRDRSRWRNCLPAGD